MDCTADLLLVFVWDKTAFGTAWSKTDNRHSIQFPMLLLAVPGAVSYKIAEHISCLVTFCVALHCPRGRLEPYKNEENHFHPVLALLGTGAPMGFALSSEEQNRAYNAQLICFSLHSEARRPLAQQGAPFW